MLVVQIGGIPVAELNALELDLLSLLDFRTAVPRHELWLQIKAIKAVRASRADIASRCRQPSNQADVAILLNGLALKQQPADDTVVVQC